METIENYNFFLFTQLWLEANGPSDEPYDYLFPMLLKEFEAFEKSRWNEDSRPLYECIVAYLKRPQYLGLAGITGFEPELVFKYNALLEKLGADGMLMQLERWIDNDDCRWIIDHIEDNLHENRIDFPY
jgi:hypothetical protein